MCNRFLAFPLSGAQDVSEFAAEKGSPVAIHNPCRTCNRIDFMGQM